MRLSVETVTSDARFVAYNGASLANQAIEQSGFADVWPAYNRDTRVGGCAQATARLLGELGKLR